MRYIYIRTSTIEQTPELQLNDISTLVNLDECICIKEQESAYKAENNRPELEKLKNLISKQLVTDIYVWALDRLFRNRRKLIEFLTFCKIHSVKIHSYKQMWLESLNKIPEPFNEIVYDMMIQILGFIAEEESSVKSARVKNALRKSDKGKTISYKGNIWGRKSLSVQTTKKILELRNEGKSIRDIASMVKVYDSNNNGRLISKSAVHKILAENEPKKGSILTSS
jgi:DNA invertase Pin-like site-specific DNA recombinase